MEFTVEIKLSYRVMFTRHHYGDTTEFSIIKKLLFFALCYILLHCHNSDTMFVLQSCQPCHHTCGACRGPGPDECLSCVAPYQLDHRHGDCVLCCSSTVTEHCCVCHPVSGESLRQPCVSSESLCRCRVCQFVLKTSEIGWLFSDS